MLELKGAAVITKPGSLAFRVHYESRIIPAELSSTSVLLGPFLFTFPLVI